MVACVDAERELLGMLFAAMVILLYAILLALTPTLKDREFKTVFLNFHKRSFQNPKGQAFELLILSALHKSEYVDDL